MLALFALAKAMESGQYKIVDILDLNQYKAIQDIH